MLLISQMICFVQLSHFIRQTAKLVYFRGPAKVLIEPESFTSPLPTLFKAINENHKIFFCGGYILANLNSDKCGTYRNNSFLILRPCFG